MRKEVLGTTAITSRPAIARVIGTMCVLCLCCGGACQRTERMDGFVLPDLSGGYTDTRNLPGKIRVFVFFSPLDCQPCLNELELWDEISRKFAPDELSIVGISNADNSRMAVAFQEAHHLSFHVLYDQGRRKTDELKITETPMRIICDQEGTILHRSRGVVDWLNYDKAIPYLEKMIADKS